MRVFVVDVDIDGDDIAVDLHRFPQWRHGPYLAGHDGVAHAGASCDAERQAPMATKAPPRGVRMPAHLCLPPEPEMGMKDEAPAAPRSRPVYPYPAVARWDGKGDPDQAASYIEGKAPVTAPLPDWAGADFHAPYTPRER